MCEYFNVVFLAKLFLKNQQQDCGYISIHQGIIRTGNLMCGEKKLYL